MGIANPFFEFVGLVARMRAAQSAYFKCKSTEKLDAAMKLERDVDHVVASIRRPYLGEMRLNSTRSER